MKKFFKYLTIIIFIVIILSISIPQFWKYYYNEERLNFCEVDTDCALVEGGRECCQCNTIINIKYADRFENAPVPSCEKIMCEPCPHPDEITLKCEESKCIPIFE